MLIGSAAAQPGQSRDLEAEALIVDELRTLAPDAVTDFEAATAAMDAGDLEAAVVGYRKVLEAVSGFDPALRRLGSALVRLDRYDEGLPLVERAVKIRRSPANLATLAQVLAFPGDGQPEPDNKSLRRAHALATQAAKGDPDDDDYLLLRAHLELVLDMTYEFQRSVDRLLEREPELMATHYYAAIRAAMNGDRQAAELEIREAGRLGLPAEAVESFLAGGVSSRAAAWRWAKVAGIATLAWAAGLLILFICGKVLSAITLASVERDDPNAEVMGGTRKLRAVYRWVVTTAGIYWYLSLPFVAFLVVAVTGSVIYAFLMIGRIPIKLAAIIVIGALVTLFAIVRSLFVRISDEDPGRAITEADAPGLWEMTRQVAAAVGTRPVDEIWMTPGTDLAVFERGGIRERMTDRARRALLLGAGLIDGFDQSAFQAVLAHEYGHFSHRDTAGGDVAMRVQGGMFKFAMSLAAAGYAVWWNLAFQFLRVYDVLYRRISHGATRLQEVLADRIAVQRYGLQAFERGLEHVIRRSIVFEHKANGEIRAAVESKRPLTNLYSLPDPTDTDTRASIAQAVTAALEADTSEDDTHPAPKDRFRFGARVTADPVGHATGAVLDLFANVDALTKELTEVVARNVTAGTGVKVTAPVH
jgi:Zn-dependent protease with chaperone function